MQDAGGEHVRDHVEAFDQREQQLPRETKTQIRNDEAHLDPSRWWFASSAIPMIAGTLGPVASAFSICALVRPWRQKFPPGSDISKAESIDDPSWLIIVNAIQLVMAVIANLILLLNMARKIRFTIAQPLTIVAWYISSICLISLNATAAGPLKKEPQSLYIWSQAFYYGIYAACLYFICSSLMIITFYGAMKGHYSKDFQLTASQRTLMLQSIMFLMYLLIGALVFSTIEGWQYLDAVYWADVTLFTVGFGDFSAATPLGRALLFPYALVGVISLGLVIGSIRSLALDRGKHRLDARMIEKKRRRILKRMHRRGKDGILIPITEDEAGKSPVHSPTGLTEFQRREKEFELMRKIQQEAEHRRRWVAMGMSTSTWMVLWLVGAVIFEECERDYQGWKYFDGFYFAFVSLTTIGYGDVTPVSPAGKSFFVVWSLLALPTMTIMISNAGDTVVRFVREATDQLGTITILPGEQGFSKDFKKVLRSLSMGKLFDEEDNIEEDPPGFLGEAQPVHRGESDEATDAEVDRRHGMREKPDGELDRQARGPKEPPTQADRDCEITNDEAKKSALSAGGTTTEPRPTPPASLDSPASLDTATLVSNSVRRSSTSAAPSGHLSFQDPVQRPPSKKGPRSKKVHPSRGGNLDFSSLKMSRAVSIPRTDLPIQVPANRADYRVVLINEICRVTQHLKLHPPRKYTFQEWAWYLKLIGEDESSAETHKKAVPQSHKKGKDEGHTKHASSGGGDYSSDHNGDGEGVEQSHSASGNQQSVAKEDADKLQWSWVGARSPLMGSQEEAEWILERLEQRLADELRAARDETAGLPRSAG